MLQKYRAPVRCSKGHIFTTIWAPMVSLKAARLSPSKRYQRCPVGHHWAVTTKLDPAHMTPEELQQAEQNKDVGLV